MFYKPSEHRYLFTQKTEKNHYYTTVVIRGAGNDNHFQTSDLTSDFCESSCSSILCKFISFFYFRFHWVCFGNQMV